MGKLGLALVGEAMLSKSLIQFSADGWDCVRPPLPPPTPYRGLRPNYVRGNGNNGDVFQRELCQDAVAPMTVVVSAPDSTVGHSQRTPLLEAPGHARQIWLSLLWGHCSFLLLPGAHKVLSCPPRVCFPSPVEVLYSDPTDLQSQIPWGFLIPLLDLLDHRWLREVKLLYITVMGKMTIVHYVYDVISRTTKA